VNNGSYTINLVYNALGQQVEQDAGSSHFRLVFPYHTSGEKMGWYDVNAGYFTRYQMLVAGREVRFYPTNLRYYYHANHLGSGAMVTDNTGAAFGERMYYPYGQNWSAAGAAVTQEFAAFRDSVLGGDDVYVTPFRHYRTDVYRWLSPDPLAGDVMNPQSLNRYAYVLNNPTNLVDPLGLDPPQGPPPHPGCGDDPTIQCVYQRYHWSIPGMFGAGVTCYVDGVRTPCDMTYGLVQSGSAAVCPNNDCTGVRVQQGPGGTTVITQSQTITGQVPGGCVTFGPNPPPCNAASSIVTFTITLTVNDVLLTHDQAYVLGEAGRLAEGPVNLAMAWTGGAIGAPLLADAAVTAWPYALTAAFIIEAAYPGCLGEFASGVAPAPSGASTPCYAVGVSVGQAIDWLKKH